MHDEISTFFGKAGLDLQIGSTLIECEAPEGVAEATAKDGTTVKVGDVVRMRQYNTKRPKGGRPGVEQWSDPLHVTAIFTDGGCSELAVVRVDDPERVTVCWMPWRLWGPDYGKGGYCDWFQEVEILDQAAVDAWWNEKRTLKPGWHSLETSQMLGNGRVRIGKDGVPTMVERSRTDTGGIKTVLKVAEITTGYDLAVGRRYCDEYKSQRRVTTARRRQPPKVGG